MCTSDGVGGDIFSAEGCQEVADPHRLWAPQLGTDGVDCIQEFTQVWEQRKLQINPSCPSNTVATFTNLINLNQIAVGDCVY